MTEHGGTRPSELAALGLTETEILDLSVNVVPFEIDPGIKAAMTDWDPRSYPDPECMNARSVLAERFGWSPSRVVLGNGATELLWTLFDALEPRRALVLEPTFAEFRAAAEAKGVPVLSVFDEATVWPMVTEYFHEVDVVYLTHPNNPTGVLAPLDRLLLWAQDHPGVIFVLDESFVSMSEAHEDLNRDFPENVIRLRSLTKDFGLAGLRVGYALAPASIVAEMEKRRPPWTVNGLAQAVVPAALAAEFRLEAVRKRLFQARDELFHAAQASGFRPQPSSTIYVLFEVGEATRIKTRLLTQHAIRVRDCTSFGLPRHIRVAAREGDATDRLLAALKVEV
ncbi:MAG: aminotransferase class I/II-fold pyridoxal phosphate-dependent enzyme [Myxococcales bacterium]|nr:aminotransferase class I/II-fold pyridoxal phosphate-dependent enzyme [Myxococcales bacterium]